MLTPKKKKFADEFVKTGNQSEAYRRAYNCKNWKPESITNKAYALMKDVDVMARIEKMQAKIDKKTIASAQEIRETLTKIIRGETLEECVTTEGTGMGTSESRIIEKQVTPKDRIKACELLAKMDGVFSDNNVNVNIKPVILDDI